MLAKILRGHDPSVIGPGECDLLVPGIVKLPATVVMVAQHREPGLAAERPRVDPVKGLGELHLGGLLDLGHGAAAARVHPLRVKVVAHVQDVLHPSPLSALLHLLGHYDLRLVVDALHIAAGLLAGPRRGAASLVEALFHVVHATAGPHERKDVEPGATTVLLPEQTAPISDCEDMHLPCARKDHLWPGHAVVLSGCVRWRDAIFLQSLQIADRRAGRGILS
mmetsp:Transcript_81167/g.194776  ORF Transcript_81167/g.194776 Transcript_81167/m.194776 type:complete len:222 (+) Transcript_81167:746-1411(+)